MFDLKGTIIAVGAASVISAVATWWVTADYKEAKYQAVLSQIRLDAADALELARAKALAAERAYNSIAQDIEVQNARHRQELDEIGRDNERLTSERGMYDRGTPESNCPVPATPNAASKPPNPSTGTRLSKELEQFLLRETRRADQAASYAKTCYEWVQELRKDK